MIRIQKRDQRTQAMTYEQRFLKTKHVQESEFRGCHPSEAYRRLQQLVDAGFMRAVRPFPGSRELVYVLTEKGVAEARKHSAWDISYNPRLNPSMLEHDTLVTMVRIRMCQMLGGRWIPEVVLRAKSPPPDVFIQERAIGDGIFVRPDERKIAIELENSVKSRERYERLLKLWAARTDVDFILYISTEPMIHRRLQARMKDVVKNIEDLPIGLVSYEELFKPWPLKIWTPEGDEITLQPRPEMDIKKGAENVANSN